LQWLQIIRVFSLRVFSFSLNFSQFFIYFRYPDRNAADFFVYFVLIIGKFIKTKSNLRHAKKAPAPIERVLFSLAIIEN